MRRVMQPCVCGVRACPSPYHGTVTAGGQATHHSATRPSPARGGVVRPSRRVPQDQPRRPTSHAHTPPLPRPPHTAQPNPRPHDGTAAAAVATAAALQLAVGLGLLNRRWRAAPCVAVLCLSVLCSQCRRCGLALLLLLLLRLRLLQGSPSPLLPPLLPCQVRACCRAAGTACVRITNNPSRARSLAAHAHAPHAVLITTAWMHQARTSTPQQACTSMNTSTSMHFHAHSRQHASTGRPHRVLTPC